MTRRYESATRRDRARQTRARIIATAVQMLVDEGPAAMTIAELARRAEVSPQTIYNAIGGKAEVVNAAYDVTLAGDDDPTPMSERPAFRAIQTAADLGSFARAYAHWVALIYVRVGTLLGALVAHGSGGDALLEAFIAKINRERRTGNGNGLRALAARGLLAAGDLEKAIDAVWALTGPETWFRLVDQRGWAPEEYERWLARMLEAALSEPADQVVASALRARRAADAHRIR